MLLSDHPQQHDYGVFLVVFFVDLTVSTVMIILGSLVMKTIMISIAFACMAALVTARA